jgi:endo-alpha-1,4-polygalactosaminidase (GH114 family)
MYTVEYYDDADQRPTWCVVEWTTSENQKTGKTIERCGTQSEAESIAVAYMLIDRLTFA